MLYYSPEMRLSLWSVIMKDILKRFYRFVVRSLQFSLGGPSLHRSSFLSYSQAKESNFELFCWHGYGWLIYNLRTKTVSYIIQNPWDLEPIKSTVYICQINELLERRLFLQALMGHSPLHADLERQSILCVLVSSSSLWLFSPNCQASGPGKTSQWQCILLGVTSFRADTHGSQDTAGFCFTSVFTSGWDFWVTVLAQWFPLSLWFSLQIKTGELLFSSHPPGLLSVRRLDSEGSWQSYCGPRVWGHLPALDTLVSPAWFHSHCVPVCHAQVLILTFGSQNVNMHMEQKN